MMSLDIIKKKIRSLLIKSNDDELHKISSYNKSQLAVFLERRIKKNDILLELELSKINNSGINYLASSATEVALKHTELTLENKILKKILISLDTNND